MSFAVSLFATVLSAAPASQAPSYSDADLEIAKAMDVGFRTCSSHLTNRQFLTEANKDVFSAVGVTLNADVSQMHQSLASAMGMTDPIYADVASEYAELKIIASKDSHVCKVTIANTDRVLNARLAVEDEFRKATTWKYDPSGSGTQDGLMAQAFVLAPEKPGPKMVMVINGPNTVYNNGVGIQAIMTVAFTNMKAR